MTSSEIAGLYERDIRKLIEKINFFKAEENLWKNLGSIRNSSGNLALHIIGGLNFLIGATLSHTAYARNRDQECANEGIERRIIVEQLEELAAMINKTVNQLTREQMKSPYP